MPGSTAWGGTTTARPRRPACSRGNSTRYLGIEIGGTKLQIAAGVGTGKPFAALWRERVESGANAERIRQQLVEGVEKLLAQIGVKRDAIAGVGIGFGGPVDAATGRVVLSHQVAGRDEFPLTDWVRDAFGWPAVVHNDADTAALAEARFGAGRGFDPVLYVTVGSGIGGGLVIGGKIYRGEGAGATEIGHLHPPIPDRVRLPAPTVESVASGFGIEERARKVIAERSADVSKSADRPASRRFTRLLGLAGGEPQRITTQTIVQAAAQGDELSCDLLADAIDTLGWALAQAITLLNPGRVVVGGGVSLIGEQRFFAPLRRAVSERVFQPFADRAEIVPALLGEEVVVHGALALAHDAFPV
jgi:glucokinase